jgi:ABC-2 type transport system permease protein
MSTLEAPNGGGRFIDAVSDAYALTGRYLRHISRVPEKLVNVTVAPIAMVVLFGYLFGSVITVPGGNYREFIMAGIFTQVMLGIVGTTAVGVVDDMRNGLVDRFRSLPMSRSAVLIGRTLSDLVLAAISCLIMAGVGYLIGWRSHRGILFTLAGFGLLLLLGYAMAWLGALVGLLVRNPETVSSITLLLTVPATFLSSAFIPLYGLPPWLRAVAEWNPITIIAGTCRDLFGNVGGLAGSTVPNQHSVPASLITVAVLLGLFVPLAVRAYHRAVAR